MSDFCPNLHNSNGQQLKIIFFIMCWTIDNPPHCTNLTLSYDSQKTMKKVEELVRNIPTSIPVF